MKTGNCWWDGEATARLGTLSWDAGQSWSQKLKLGPGNEDSPERLIANEETRLMCTEVELCSG